MTIANHKTLYLKMCHSFKTTCRGTNTLDYLAPKSVISFKKSKIRESCYWSELHYDNSYNGLTYNAIYLQLILLMRYFTYYTEKVNKNLKLNSQKESIVVISEHIRSKVIISKVIKSKVIISKVIISKVIISKVIIRKVILSKVILSIVVLSSEQIMY